jgi:hypothetical protein
VYDIIEGSYMMPQARRKNGRPPALTGDLGFLAAYALGKGADLCEVARAAGVSSSTILRFANHAQLASGPRCEALKRLALEVDSRADQVQNLSGADVDFDPF